MPRDASRLLADACLVVQRMLGVDAAPRLVAPSAAALITAADGASHVVLAIWIAGVTKAWAPSGRMSPTAPPAPCSWPGAASDPGAWPAAGSYDAVPLVELAAQPTPRGDHGG